MDVTQLLIISAAVLGIIVVGFLAIIPAAMELRDVAERRNLKTSDVKRWPPPRSGPLHSARG